MHVTEAYLSMVLSGHALTDGRFHKTRQRGKHVDGWVDVLVVQLTLNVNLALCNVASKIGDGMCDIIVGHGQNGELCDGAWSAFNTASTLVDGRQIGIHITGVTTTSRHLHADVSEHCNEPAVPWGAPLPWPSTVTLLMHAMCCPMNQGGFACTVYTMQSITQSDLLQTVARLQAADLWTVPQSSVLNSNPGA